jgi:nitrate/nitrite transport system substrate-binding protein
MMAILEASRWIDASLPTRQDGRDHRRQVLRQHRVDAINQRILGRYQNGLGKTWDDPNHMKFFNDGAVNFPYLSDGMWFLTQHKRWGLLKSTRTTWPWPSRSTRSTSTSRPPRPEDQCPRPMRSSKLIDGVVWDGKDPKKYAALQGHA